jgi:hypothetical protein
MMATPAQAIPISVVNENSKYAGSVVVKKAGPPPARKMAGAIDVIGGGNLSSRRPESGVSPAPSMEEQPPEVVRPRILNKIFIQSQPKNFKVYHLNLIFISA